MKTTVATLLLGLGLGAAVAAPVDERLPNAVRDGDHAQVRALLARHVNVNARLADKSTALNWAVDRQDEDSVQMLLAAGAQANLADGEGATPILLACEGGNPAIVRRLLAAKADAKVVRKDGTSALSLCAASSTPDVVEQLIAVGAPVDTGNPAGQTPLMFAAARGQAENIKVLARHGANINQATPKGFTPLFFAAKTGSPDAVGAVIDAGGNVAYVAPDGSTALHVALFANNLASAKYLVEHGADLKRWDVMGRQPLHVVALTGDVELAKLMLAKGADANALTKTAFRTVPYQHDPYAAGQGGKFVPASTDGADWKPRVVYMALDGGAEPKPPAISTPLIMASKAGQPQMMKALAAGGANPLLRGPDGMSVLLAASGSGSLETVKYALEIDPDATQKADGLDAMQVAIQNSRAPEAEAIMQYLADHGAPLDDKNARGQTTAAMAARATPAMKALFDKLVAARAAQAPVPASSGTK